MSWNRYALNFDGDDYVDCGANVVLNSDIKTLEVWFNPDVVPDNSTISLIAGKNDFDPGSGYALLLSYDRLYARTWDGNGVQRDARSAIGAVSVDNLYYAALVHDFDNDDLLIYLNGAWIETTECIGFTSAADSFKIGRRGDAADYWFDGKIYQIRYSNSARTAAEITANWNNGNGGNFANDADTVALWHIGESSGSTIHDETTNANHGTITGATWSRELPFDVVGKGKIALSIKLYDEDVSSPTFVENLTSRVKGLKFSTKLHGGYHIAKFSLDTKIPESWEWITRRNFYRLIIEDPAKTVFEGRVEDIALSAGRTDITVYGYYANLSDVPYTTEDDDVASVIIKAILTANCAQISSDQTHIDATDITIDLAADESYLDIYPQEIVERLLDFSDTGKSKWYFAIWEDRIPYLSARSVSAVDWLVALSDFKTYKLKHRAGDLWNSCYAVYDVAGTLTRTGDADDSDSQSKYGLKRQYVVPNLGTVVQATAEAYRDGWVEEYKDVKPKMVDMVLGGTVYDANGVAQPSWRIRAGDVIRVRDLVPASGMLDAVTLDALRTFYIVETEYSVDRAEMKIIPDTENTSLDAILARET